MNTDEHGFLAQSQGEVLRISIGTWEGFPQLASLKRIVYADPSGTLDSGASHIADAFGRLMATFLARANCVRALAFLAMSHQPDNVFAGTQVVSLVEVRGNCRGPKWTPGARTRSATSNAPWLKPNCPNAEVRCYMSVCVGFCWLFLEFQPCFRFNQSSQNE